MGIAAAGMLLAMVITTKASAETDPMAATGSREAQDEATRSIPWKYLANNEQRMVQYVVRNNSIYRRMPTRVIDCDPKVFNYLGQNPQVVTELWKMMGVCNLTLEKVSDDTYRATDDNGTSGVLKVLSDRWNDDAQNSILLYCEGTYKGAPLPGEITARSVLLLRSGSVVETNGRPYVTARLDSWVLIDRLGVELVAKTIQPLLTKTADHNFTETMKFVGTFSKTAENNPAGMVNLSRKLEAIDEPTRVSMGVLCHETAARYQAIAAKSQESAVRVASQSSP
ncbi:hypothetical protein [Aeoliella mucimassa]|uniref:hypothetical protein n=1 Tax=Aeoliella mucimassa TaxID=2527972 RepID=UPI0011A79217|nr:hypothetical protein [Aeoliella mucimassa]